MEIYKAKQAPSTTLYIYYGEYAGSSLRDEIWMEQK